MFEISLVLLAIVFIILATIKFKIHPFLSLFLAALGVGIASGIPVSMVVEIIGTGFGSTLSSIGFIIAFGALIGVLLEKTKGTQIIVAYLLKLFGSKQSALAMNITGFIVSIPVFCDSAFVILSSINKGLSKKTAWPLGLFAVSLATGLYAAHVFVPPTPGPLAAAALVDANLGLVMVWGLVLAIPVSLSGHFWSRWIHRAQIKEKAHKSSLQKQEETPLKLSLTVFVPIVLPIVLIGLKSIAIYPTKPFGNGNVFKLLDALGNPIIALLFGLLTAYLFFAKQSKGKQLDWTVEALKEAGIIILITGAGGAFGSILKQLDIASVLQFSSSTPYGGLLIAFLFAAVLKSAQGSSTVAIVTTAAFIAPLLGGFGLDTEIGKVFSVLAIGAGAMTVSHINDSYFWVVSQFSKMNVKTALKTFNLGTAVQGFVAIFLVMLLYSIAS